MPERSTPDYRRQETLDRRRTLRHCNGVCSRSGHNIIGPTFSDPSRATINATGDGMGNSLSGPRGIAVDDSGNAYVTGSYSNNAFKITPDGAITEIIDPTGDGMGNSLSGPNGIAVDDSGNVYVSALYSNNAFKIELCDTLAHYPLFADCLSGPEGVADPGCACPDDDADTDVDLADFARFQRTFVGP